MERIKVFAPATVANIGPGFDIFGLALEGIGDTMEVSKSEIMSIEMKNGHDLPTDPKLNVAGVAVQKLLDELGSDQCFHFKINKNVLPGSGLGSSASSSAAAVFGANELLGRPYDVKKLVSFAMEGERASSGVAHADNVAPALLGGFTFIRSYDPLDVVSIDYPSDLHLAIIHPQIEVKTADSKKILKKEVTLGSAVTQWGNVAGMVAGLINKDYQLIERSMVDVIVEPIRSLLIPGYNELKRIALTSGALGCNIAGSGPSVFALCKGKETAAKTANQFSEYYQTIDIDYKIYVSAINPKGAHVL